MRVGRGNSLLIPCSQEQNLHIWAELGNFSIEFEKFTVNFPVLVTRLEMQVEIGPAYLGNGHTDRGSALVDNRVSLAWFLSGP
jgi:hypothetical protein